MLVPWYESTFPNNDAKLYFGFSFSCGSYCGERRFHWIHSGKLHLTSLQTKIVFGEERLCFFLTCVFGCDNKFCNHGTAVVSGTRFLHNVGECRRCLPFSKSQRFDSTGITFIAMHAKNVQETESIHLYQMCRAMITEKCISNCSCIELAIFFETCACHVGHDISWCCYQYVYLFMLCRLCYRVINLGISFRTCICKF